MKRSRLPPFSSGDQNSSEDDDDLPKKRLRQLNRRDILDDEELPLQSPARFPQPAVAQPIHPNTRKNKNHKKKPHEDPSESEAHKPKRRKNKASEDQHSQVDSTTQDGSVPSMRRRKAADGRKNEDSSSNLFSDTSSPETKPKRAAPSRKRDSIVAEEAPESQSWIGLFGGDAEESDQEGPEDPSLEESESPSGDGTLAWTHLLKDALKKKKVANAGDAGAEVNKSPESFIESAVVDLEDFIESNFENDNVDYKRLKDSKADELKKQQKRRVCAISEITAKRYRDELLLSLRFVSPHQPMWSPVDPPPFCPIVSFPNYVQKDNGTTRPIEEQERAAMGLKAKWSLATIGAAKWLKVENCLDHDTIMHEDDEFYRTEAKFFGSRNSYLKLNLSHCSELLKQQYPVEIEQINKRFHWTNDEIEAVKKFTKEHKIFSNLIKQASTRAKKSGISSVKPCDTVAGVVGSEERSVEGQADAIVENERPADAIVENERLTDGIVENEGQADAIVENERPADGIVENKPQADGTEENERPADGGTEENERAADGTEENERPADGGTEENERPADGGTEENERAADGTEENERAADGTEENERPADGGTEENERPADGGTEENERAADGTEENERAADGTEENERADSIVETDGDGVIGKDFQSMSKGVVISDPPAKVSHIRVVKPTGPKQLRMKDFFSTPKSKAPTMENSSKFNNNVDAAARGEDVGSLKDSLAHSKSDLKNDDKTEEDADDNSSYEDPEGWRSFIDKKKSSNKTVFVDELASDEDGCDEVASSSHEDDEEEEAKEIYSTLISNKKEVDKENVLAFHNVIMEEQIEKEYISKFTEAGAKERRQKRKEELEAHLTRRQIERQNNADGEDQRELDEENEIERYLMELKEKMSSSCSSGGTASSGISSDIESSDNVNGEEEEVIQFSSPTPYQKKRPQRTQRSSDEVVLPKVDDDDDDDQHVAFCDDDNNDSARHLFPPSSKWDLFTTKSF